ncbi:hypothetical protein AB0J63_34335 [Streptosporangium canum]|uniref:hypothetical protein n=1 Tax=Streptosporangium canum TaxID=324952 RepID=UPI00343346DE
MNSFLSELGKQLVTRWIASLVIPGTLLAGAVILAHLLGHAHALEFAVLRSRLDTLAATPAGGHSGTVLIAVGAFLLGSAAAGLTATALGLLVEWTWTLTGSVPPLKWIAGLRHHRWEKAEGRAKKAERELLADTGDALLRARARRAIARRDAICLVEAERPTWIGDRLRAADVRVHRSYRVDLAAVWPRLWLVLPDAVRTELVAVQDRCASAARLAGWGLFYVALGAFWWPALIVGAAALVISRYRSRLAVAVYADLVEASVDLYSRDLAVQLGLQCPDRLTREIGGEITAIVRKDEVTRGHDGGNHRADPVDHARSGREPPAGNGRELPEGNGHEPPEGKPVSQRTPGIE